MSARERTRRTEPQQRSQALRDQLLRLPEVMAATGKGRSTIYRDVDEGRFPRPVQIGAQSVAWRASDVDAWIEARPLVGHHSD